MKIALRVCASPLTPGHLAAFLRDVPGSGFDTGGDIDAETVMDAAIEEGVGNPLFAGFAAKAVWKELNKPVAKLSPRNQFLGVAPVLEIGRVRKPLPEGSDGFGVEIVDRSEANLDIPAFETHPLRDLIDRPFVIDLGTTERLSCVLKLGDALVSSARLAGFCERHVGAAAVLTLQ